MDYFKMAEAELEKVGYSTSEAYNRIDQVRVAKAEVYAKLAHAKVLKGLN
jgi:hypothetical protein